MKLKLVVLAGAKEGLEIPLKKEKFLIGRAKECALRAGSEAISRRHCAISRSENGYTVKDLGSRNGTHVNDKRITEEVPLVAGNELRVGPLKFRVDVIAEKAATPEKGAAPTSNAPSPAINGKPRKQPPMKDVADVVQRTMSMSDSATEDDVSRWLLGITDKDGPETLKETRSMRAEDTRTTMNRVTMTGDSATVEDVAQLAKAAEAAAEVEEAKSSDTPTVEGTNDEEGSGVWKWMKRGKGAVKKAPGKLPPRTDQQPSKDSRDAAADILREMQRRR
jgi:pSer/pThr/pTyr-binding forkhead associated (FHA) protein